MGFIKMIFNKCVLEDGIFWNIGSFENLHYVFNFQHFEMSWHVLKNYNVKIFQEFLNAFVKKSFGKFQNQKFKSSKVQNQKTQLFENSKSFIFFDVYKHHIYYHYFPKIH